MTTDKKHKDSIHLTHGYEQINNLIKDTRSLSLNEEYPEEVRISINMANFFLSRAQERLIFNFNKNKQGG